jgi:hypothetical protein
MPEFNKNMNLPTFVPGQLYLLKKTATLMSGRELDDDALYRALVTRVCLPGECFLAIEEISDVNFLPYRFLGPDGLIYELSPYGFMNLFVLGIEE